jgi:O-antigen ligase
MKLVRKYVDEILLVLFIFALPLQRRHVFFSVSPTLHGQFTDFLAISLYASDLIAILIAIRLLWLIFTKNVIFTKQNCYLFLIPLFLLLNFAYSLYVSRGNTTYIYYYLIKIVEFSTIFTYFTIKRVNIKVLLFAVTATAIFQGTIGIIQFIVQKSIGLKFLGEETLARNIDGVAKIDTSFGKFIRAYGTFAHPNQLSAFLIVACATTLGLFFIFHIEKKSKWANLSLAALSILILFEFSTFSRSGLIALFICLGIILCLIKQKQQSIKIPLIVSVAAIAASVIIFRPFLFPRLTITDQSTGERFYYNEIGAQLIKQNPVLGVGMGNLIPKTAAAIGDYDQAWEVQPAHNYFLDIAIEFGIPGLIIFFIFLMFLILNLIRKLISPFNENYIYRAALLSVLVAILILMQFDHYFYTLQQTQLLLWALLGMITAESLHVENPHGPMVQW